MGIKELKSALEGLSSDDRRQMAAFLVSLRHKDLAEYRASLGRKIDDTDPDQWLTLEDFDRRLAS